jgi:outer membrane protein OmpA-like peptidoglycan-associated protein
MVEHPAATLDEHSVTPRVSEEQKSEPRNDPGGDIPLDDLSVPFTPAPVVPEIIEEATVSDELQPTTSRAIWRRFSNFGMVVVLIGCLLFVLNSVLSNEVIERIVKLVGTSESLLVASAPPVSRSSAVAGTEVVRSELTAQMAGSSLQPSSLETKFPPTQLEALKEPERTFTVSFSSDSDVLRSENWNALDSAVVMLGRFPDMIVLIADLSQESLGELYDSDLSSSRIGAVEHYLMAAGVNPRRLHVQEHTALKNSDGSAMSSIEDTDLLNEILTINLESNRSQ